VGRKKWWFIPPSQTAYLMPSINVNGFSAHTKTLVGKQGAEMSPWMKKLERYSTILNPGDVLINPPWFWHGILNLGDKNDKSLVIGAPSRYGQGHSVKAGFFSNALFNINAIVYIIKKHGLAVARTGKIKIQNEISNNRRDREKKALLEDGH
jgi:hypothetical protein